VTGVGHTSLSSASIRSGEIASYLVTSALPIRSGSAPARVHTGTQHTPGTGGVSSLPPPRGGHLMISPLCTYAGATAGMGVAHAAGVSEGMHAGIFFALGWPLTTVSSQFN
jgi:hypothetical protein